MTASIDRPRQLRSVTDEARRGVLAREAWLARRRADWLPWWLANDHVRRCSNAVQRARLWANVLGPEHPRTWALLDLAARVDREGFAVEAELDAILQEGRL